MTEHDPISLYVETPRPMGPEGTPFHNDDELYFRKAREGLKSHQEIRAETEASPAAPGMGGLAVNGYTGWRRKEALPSLEAGPIRSAGEWIEYMRKLETGAEAQDDYGLAA